MLILLVLFCEYYSQIDFYIYPSRLTVISIITLPFRINMFPNSHNYILSSFASTLKPLTPLRPLSNPPNSFHKSSPYSFQLTDCQSNHTLLQQLSFSPKGTWNTKKIQQFQGQYENSCFAGEGQYCLMVSKEGDFLCYGMWNKQTLLQQGMHPNTFQPLQLHSIGDMFISCGGNIKHNGQNHRVIKIWQPTQEQLIMKGRISTHHTHSIQNSLILGRSHLLTLSTDKTIRSFNLATLQTTCTIPTTTTHYSGCSIDWSSAILGGITPTLDIYDIRSKRLVRTGEFSNKAVLVTDICRLTENVYLVSDVNIMVAVDARKMQGWSLGEYKGERISKVMVLGEKEVVVGNKSRTVQVWSTEEGIQAQ